MDNCIFCKIIEGSIPSKTIYEDDDVLVIMNINPEENGHLLLLPKKHIDDFMDIDNELLAHINDVIKKVIEKLQDRLNPSGYQIITNKGSYQEIKHYHVHIKPGYEDMQPIVDLDIIFDRLK